MRQASAETSIRAKVITGAAKVFARRGFQDASVREIAAEADLSTGAIYSNFDGKGGLFLAVLEERIDPKLAVLYEAARAAPRDGVGARLGKEFARYVRAQRRWLILLIEFWAQAARDPKLRPKFAERHARLRAATVEVLAERAARLDAPLALPAEQLATVLIALTNGMAVEQLGDPGTAGEDLYGRALDVLLG